jgi:hypothetical protein
MGVSFVEKKDVVERHLDSMVVESLVRHLSGVDATSLAPELIGREEGPLFEKWKKGITGQVTGSDRQLRGSFVELVVNRPEGGWNEPKQHVIPCVEIRHRLKPLNPTYMPQLARFQNLVVVTAPTSPRQPNFEHATAGAIEKQGQRTSPSSGAVAPCRARGDAQEFRRRITGRCRRPRPVSHLNRGRRPSALLALLRNRPSSSLVVRSPLRCHDGAASCRDLRRRTVGPISSAGRRPRASFRREAERAPSSSSCTTPATE